MSLSSIGANAGTGKRIGTPPSTPAGVSAKDSAAAAVPVLSADEQEKLAKDVNELFAVILTWFFCEL